MKKLFFLLTLLSAVTFLSVFSVYAGDAVINSESKTKGYVTIKFTDMKDALKNQTIRIIVQKNVKDGEKYQYTPLEETVYIPLQMGAGEYNIQIVEMVPNTNPPKGKPLKADKVTVPADYDEKEMYKISSPIVNYGASKEAVPAFLKLVEATAPNDKKVAVVHKTVVEGYTYDFEKAKSVQAGYVPVLDNTYKEKKGICYDYSALLGGSLRKMNVPTRLVMGYRPDVKEYHAWNEVLLNGKWVCVDATYDAAVFAAKKPYTLGKDSSKNTIVKIY